MSAKLVEWVLVIYYGAAAHKAIYGRLSGESTYSKDYIQLSRTGDFIADLESAFPGLLKSEEVHITYRWPSGSTSGKIFRKSADRPHLAWDTNSAPAAWKMTPTPTNTSAQTIVGDPDLKSAEQANFEFSNLATSGLGQPFLLAVKLRGEEDVLHLRVCIRNPITDLSWADLTKAPSAIQDLANKTSSTRALAWQSFPKIAGTKSLWFDPSIKTNPWTEGTKSAPGTATTAGKPNPTPGGDAPADLDNDLLAEGLEVSPEQVEKFEEQIDAGNFAVEDSSKSAKTRGSAQRAFAKKVKANYEGRCALTGIQTRAFLVASHIVPWSVDKKIRLDPANGICLSVLVDKAFEQGIILVNDDLTIEIDWKKVGSDEDLFKQLEGFDGQKLRMPKSCPPKADYLKRRREL